MSVPSLKKRAKFSSLFSGIYLFKVNNGNTKTISEICSKLTAKTQVVVTSLKDKIPTYKKIWKSEKKMENVRRERKFTWKVYDVSL